MSQRIFLLFNSIENILLIAYNIVFALTCTQLVANCTPSAKNHRPTPDTNVKPGTPTAASPATFRSKETTMSREEPSNELAQSPVPKKDKVADKNTGGAGGGKKAPESPKKKASEKVKATKNKNKKDDGIVGGGEGGDGAEGEGEGDQYDEDGNVRHEKTVRIEMNDDQTKSMTKSMSIAESNRGASKRKQGKKEKKEGKDKTTVTKEGNSIQMDAVAKKSENNSDNNKKSVTVEVSKNCSVTFEGSPANV